MSKRERNCKPNVLSKLILKDEDYDFYGEYTVTTAYV